MKVQPNPEQAILFKENEDLYKRMNKSISRKIATKEEEIKNVDTIYDKKVEEAKGEGERKYLQSLDHNQQRILDESQTVEEKIQSYRDQLKKTQDTVTREETGLKSGHRDKVETMKAQMEESFQDDFANIQENRNDIQASTQNAVKEIATQAKSEKLLMEGNAQYEINALSSEFNQKAANNEKSFRSTLDQDTRLHNAEIKQQKDDLKKLMTLDGEKNKRLGEEKNRVNKDQLDYQDKHQAAILKQRNDDFKVRYDKIVQEHNEILKDLATHLESDMKKMVSQTSTEKKKISDRIEDPFYRVDKLNPKLVEDIKDVTVSLPIAEYEKENVHLSTQGRSIKITLSRKYSDSMNAEDGSMNRSTRSELFSKELATTDLLSNKNITQSYQDGILTFKIKKA